MKTHSNTCFLWVKCLSLDWSHQFFLIIFTNKALLFIKFLILFALLCFVLIFALHLNKVCCPHPVTSCYSLESTIYVRDYIEDALPSWQMHSKRGRRQEGRCQEYYGLQSGTFLYCNDKTFSRWRVLDFLYLIQESVC